MLRSFEIFVGMRYATSKSRNRFISFIATVSMVGIALGVTALIVVLSVMNGFQEELRDKILGVVPHVQVTQGQKGLRNWRDVGERVKVNQFVNGLAPYVDAQGLLVKGKGVHGVMVRGILPEEETLVSDVFGDIGSKAINSLKEGSYNVILGKDLAIKLGVDIGDKVLMMAPQGSMTPVGVIPRVKRLTVSGVFEIGMYEYDVGLIYIHLSDAQKIYRLGDSVTGVRLKVKDIYEAPIVAMHLSEVLNGNFFISDWTMSHKNFFRAVQLEKRIMFIILFLIVAVAVFNIVTTLVMTVADKSSDIAILKTLGAKTSVIMKIFVIYGSMIGFIGTFAGFCLGLLIAENVSVIMPFIEGFFGVDLLAKDVYYIDEIPSKVQMSDIIWIVGISFIMSVLATIYPSIRAARTVPVEILRHE